MGWGSLLGTVAGTVFGGPLGGTIGGALGGAIDGSRSARQASAAQQQATDQAIGEQRRQFDTLRQDQAPYREQGVNALRQLATGLNQMPTAQEVMAEPGYQFGLNQGQTALQRGFAARGGRVSGAAMKAATQYGTDYATTKYGESYGRRQDRLTRLQQLASMGQGSANFTGQAGMQTGQNVSGLISSQGDATASGRLAQGNIWGNAIGDIAAQYGRNQRAITPSDNVGGLSAGQGLNGWW